MSVIYAKFFAVRPLKQVTIQWLELCRIGSTKVSKIFSPIENFQQRGSKQTTPFEHSSLPS